MLIHFHGLLGHFNGIDPSSLILLLTPVFLAMTSQNVCREKGLFGLAQGQFFETMDWGAHLRGTLSCMFGILLHCFNDLEFTFWIIVTHVCPLCVTQQHFKPFFPSHQMEQCKTNCWDSGGVLEVANRHLRTRSVSASSHSTGNYVNKGKQIAGEKASKHWK